MGPVASLPLKPPTTPCLKPVSSFSSTSFHRQSASLTYSMMPGRFLASSLELFRCLFNPFHTCFSQPSQSKSTGRRRTTSHSAGKPAATLHEKASSNLLATPSTLAPKLSSRDLKHKVSTDVYERGAVFDMSSRKASQSSKP